MKRPALFLLVLLAACGASKQTKLVTTMRALDAASSALVSYSDIQQDTILSTSETSAEWEERIRVFRGKRDAVKNALILAYVATGAALAADSEDVGAALQLAGEALKAFKTFVGSGP